MGLRNAVSGGEECCIWDSGMLYMGFRNAVYGFRNAVYGIQECCKWDSGMLLLVTVSSLIL